MVSAARDQAVAFALHIAGSLFHRMGHRSRPLLYAHTGDLTARALIEVVAELQQDAGWMAYDAGKQDLATGYFTSALRLARQAGNRLLGGRILAVVSHQAIYLGNKRQAIDFAQAARNLTRQVATPRVIAMEAAMEACAHAAAADAKQCHHALGQPSFWKPGSRRVGHDALPQPIRKGPRVFDLARVSAYRCDLTVESLSDVHVVVDLPAWTVKQPRFLHGPGIEAFLLPEVSQGERVASIRIRTWTLLPGWQPITPLRRAGI